LATEYLDVDDAIDGYAEAVEVSVDQAKHGILNLGQLESALARPRNAAMYEDADIVRQGASLFWGIARITLSATATSARQWYCCAPS
jgi:hypothetical protein